MDQKTGKVRRVQLDFPEEAWNELQRLKEEGGYPTNAATVRRALALLRWHNDNSKNGWVIGEAEKRRFCCSGTVIKLLPHKQRFGHFVGPDR